MENPTISSANIWDRVFESVQNTINAPMVWLAMQAAKPITLDHNYFVVGLPADKQYLAANLKTFETVTAIEDALHQVVGRILAFRLIEGETLEDWHKTQVEESPTFEPKPSPAPVATAPAAGPRAEPAREVSPTWEKLMERMQHAYRGMPSVRYPHGQARFVLEAVKNISDTMDLVMPDYGQRHDEVQEKSLSKIIDRVSSTVNLDSIFIALELFRYRDAHGK